MSNPVYFFTKNDQYYELSNFYPQGLTEEGLYWPTVEHYFQSMKFPGPDNADYRERIRRCRSPKDAKKLGRSRDIAIRTDWEEVKEQIMVSALRKKFSHEKLKRILIGTGHRELIESSPYDYYWGIGSDGSGKNRLGFLLMAVRSELQTH